MDNTDVQEILKKFGDTQLSEKETEDTPSTPKSFSLNGDIEEDVQFSRNKAMLEMCDEMLGERLKYKDASLSTKDLIGIKSELFRQNQSILGAQDDDIDVTKIIPTNIYIQINNG